MTEITVNQDLQKKNRFRSMLRHLLHYAPSFGLVPRPEHSHGISVLMRVKDESDWIIPSVKSIEPFADEIILVDNGSTDGTYEKITELVAQQGREVIRLWSQPDMDYTTLSQFCLSQARFRWVMKWDGDMVAQTTGLYDIRRLRERLMTLNPSHYYLIYLRLINLAGDLLHQDAAEMVHVEEYLYTSSEKLRYVNTGTFEAVKFPKYYKPLFWQEPYCFHVNIKPASKMLLRYFWDEWLKLEGSGKYDTLEDFVAARIGQEFGTHSLEKAKNICCARMFKKYIRYDSEKLGSYPDLLTPFLNNPRYRLLYENDNIVGRQEESK